MSKGLILRELPGVDKFIQFPEINEFLNKYDSSLVLYVVRTVIDEARENIIAGGYVGSVDELITKVANILNHSRLPSLIPVINATGIILHTNLGRAPLGQIVIDELIRVCMSYSNLEFNTESQKRGERNVHVEGLLKVLTRTESALVVNNNAAALILVLNALARNKEVIISRGELIEIGGSFRLPEIMDISGAKMVEVGTTNRTHISDYAEAITENTAFILKAHKSNFVTKGFTEEPSVKELADMAHANNLPMVYDIGSGLLNQIDNLKLCEEPDVCSSIRDGADIVTFSCDKILSGPQAGAIVGTRSLLSVIMKSPLRRALRVGKLTIAALSVVLRQWISRDSIENIPAIKMMTRDLSDLRAMAERMESALQENGVKCHVVENLGRYGGGTMPDLTIDSFAVQIDFGDIASKDISMASERLFALLLRLDTPILGILRKGRLLFDVLTLDDGDCENIVTAVAAAYRQVTTTVTES